MNSSESSCRWAWRYCKSEELEVHGLGSLDDTVRCLEQAAATVPVAKRPVDPRWDIDYAAGQLRMTGLFTSVQEMLYPVDGQPFIES